MFSHKVVANANEGAREVQLEDVSRLRDAGLFEIGRTGLSNLTMYWAAEAIITGVNGNTVTLSKPLPRAISTGTNQQMARIKYRPFSEPDSAEYEETLEGWRRYVGAVAAFVSNLLGTTGKPDLGFDMEIWNELTFGQYFLFINKYYSPDLLDYDQEEIYDERSLLVKATASYAEANPAKFAGVKFTDGMANTTPWPASTGEPARIHAISKHPYPPEKSYPADDPGGKRIDALGQETTYVPTYSVLLPEYDATALQVDTLVRDMGKIRNNVYGTIHGRNERAGGPVPVWITEANMSPKEYGYATRDEALKFKAKAATRFLPFYLNKGVERFYFYNAIDTHAADTDLEYGVLSKELLDYVRTNKAYPADDSAYTSPMLKVMSRMVSKMSEGIDSNLTSTRQLTVDSITDTHNNYQFYGGGPTSSSHPPLYAREMFTFLPYQVNSRKFVIPYYVVHRDVRINMSLKQFTIQVSGLKGSGATVSAYDPINDAVVPLTVVSRGTNSIKLTLITADYPYLLIVQES